MTGRKAVIFCSANPATDPRYNQAAREVVRAACLCGYDIVSGGTVKGTMDVVSKAAAEFGARNIGVLPEFMRGLESPDLTEVEWTSTMSSRKEAMRRGATVAIALPGGIGTLDELFETMVLVKLGRMACKVIAYDVDGFWKPLEALMDHLVEKGMLSPDDRKILHVADSIEALNELLK